MVCQEAFILSHTMVLTDVPAQEAVDGFLPPLDLRTRLSGEAAGDGEHRAAARDRGAPGAAPPGHGPGPGGVRRDPGGVRGRLRPPAAGPGGRPPRRGRRDRGRLDGHDRLHGGAGRRRGPRARPAGGLGARALPPAVPRRGAGAAPARRLAGGDRRSRHQPGPGRRALGRRRGRWRRARRWSRTTWPALGAAIRGPATWRPSSTTWPRAGRPASPCSWRPPRDRPAPARQHQLRRLRHVDRAAALRPRDRRLARCRSSSRPAARR